MAWQPQENMMRELTGYLKNTLSAHDRIAQLEATKMLAQAKVQPDINKYLTTILVSQQMPSFLSYTPLDYTTIRYSAGIMLKNDVRDLYNVIPEETKQFIHQNILVGLDDPNGQIRGFAGNVITEMVKKGGILSWKNLLPELVSRISNTTNNNSATTQEGAMGALAKVCEDNRRSLEKDYQGSRPLDYLLPNLLSFTSHTSVFVRALSIQSLCQFLPQKSQPIMQALEGILQALFARAHDPDVQVRTEVCRALGIFVDIAPRSLIPHMPGLVEYLLQQMTDESDDSLPLTAAEFWLSAGEEDILSQALTPYLPRVVPVLLKCMVYTEEEAEMMSGGNDDADEEDKAEDMKPQFAKSRSVKASLANGEDAEDANVKKAVKAAAGDDDDDLDEGEIREDDYDDDEEGEWTLRKCAAAAVDIFSTRFHGQLFEVTLPYFTENLKHPEWRYREAAVLALGAIAEGCLEIVVPHLPELVPYLLSLLNDPEPLVRQITCWTLGRYSGWAANLSSPEEKQRFFEPLMEGLLLKMLDNKKNVQSAAASAFAYLEEQSKENIIAYCNPIIQQFNLCFQKYKDKNMYVLYDCVQTLAKYAGEHLAQPDLVNLLMPALINRWNLLSDESRELWPLLECLSFVCSALGDSFSAFAAPMFERCIKILHTNLQADLQAQGNEDYDAPEKDFLVTSLDLLSAIVQAIDPAKSASLVAANSPNMFELVLACMENQDSGVRQSTYAILGDTAIYLFPQLQPLLPRVLPILLEQLDLEKIPDVEIDELFDVVTNACWSLGEIVIRQPEATEPYIEKLTERLIDIMSHEEVPTNCHENAAIALGRLAINSYPSIAPHLPAFAAAFLDIMKDVAPTDEKDTAFQGFALSVSQNPQSIENSLSEYFRAIARYRAPSERLATLFHNTLLGYKGMIPDFDSYLNGIGGNGNTAKILRERYRL